MLARCEPMWACECSGVSHCTEFAPDDQRTFTFFRIWCRRSVQFGAVVSRRISRGRISLNMAGQKPCFQRTRWYENRLADHCGMRRTADADTVLLAVEDAREEALRREPGRES